jgi:tetratricopeptide (TPR) repeat protein
MRRGDSAAALDLFDQAKRLSPRLPDIRVNVSAALIRAGDAEAAIDLLDDIASIEPELRPVAHFNRGLAYWDLERFQNAYEDFSAAIRMRPGYAPAANMLENFEVRTPAGPARQLASTPG